MFGIRQINILTHIRTNQCRNICNGLFRYLLLDLILSGPKVKLMFNDIMNKDLCLSKLLPNLFGYSYVIYQKI